jgi:hypothetical protein
MVARKVADSGKLKVISLFVTLGEGEANAEVTVSRLRLKRSVMINFCMKASLKNHMSLACASPIAL